MLYIWSNDKRIFARRAFSPFYGRAASTSTNSAGQTRCLRAVNCVRVSPHQEWVGIRDGWYVVVRQNNYRCCANHDTKLTDDTWYLMISVGGISVSARYDWVMSFVKTCRRHVSGITNWYQNHLIDTWKRKESQGLWIIKSSWECENIHFPNLQNITKWIFIPSQYNNKICTYSNGLG